jgi:hypothetical protein
MSPRTWIPRTAPGGRQQHVVVGVVEGRGGVRPTTYTFHFLVHETRSERLGALEEHVFGKVREALLSRRLVPATHAYPELEGNDLALRVLLDDQSESIRQHFSGGTGEALSSAQIGGRATTEEARGYRGGRE